MSLAPPHTGPYFLQMHLWLYIPHNSFGMWGFIGIVRLEGATYLTHPKIISSPNRTSPLNAPTNPCHNSHPNSLPSQHAIQLHPLAHPFMERGEERCTGLRENHRIFTWSSGRSLRRHRARERRERGDGDGGCQTAAVTNLRCCIASALCVLHLPCSFRSTHSSPSPLLLTVENIS